MPQNSGIYIFLDEKDNVIYVGKAKNLKKRVSSYFSNSSDLGEKTKQLISKISKIKIIKTSSELEAFLLEADLVKKYKPFYNMRLLDDKTYPFVQINIKANFPAVLISRKDNDKNSIYFGRFPSSSSVRSVLKTIRKIFPHQSVLNHPKRRCLYNHLGLCPCPPLLSTSELKEYKKNIRKIVDFLRGNTKKVIRDLEKERDQLSKHDEFEEAAVIQKRITAIKFVTSESYQPFDYEMNPNLEEDLRNREMTSLMEVLNEKGVGVKSVQRIECYDISNISGKLATGSMVVFENGTKNTHEYRRFKIKRTPGPNDFAMMQEVLKRRFSREVSPSARQGWATPGLLVIDGGKGQVSSVKKVLDELGIDIPVIGLAKRLETIITSDFREISLPRGSDPLKLVMKLRDEAHRFAITYHRKLRSKALTA